MHLEVIALDSEKMKENKVYGVYGVTATSQAADQFLENCIDECQITRFSGEIVPPRESDLKVAWLACLPELDLLKRCFRFWHCLFQPPGDVESLPWWVKNSSQPVALIAQESVRQFSDDVHECKFFEVLLSSSAAAASTDQIIELAEFLELSAINGCGILSRQQRLH